MVRRRGIGVHGRALDCGIPRVVDAPMSLLLRLVSVVCLALCGACVSDWFGGGRAASGPSLDNSQLVAGLREALAQGATRAINELGRPDGFWKDETFRIPLPDPLAGAEKTLRQLGQGSRLDAFQLTLNRAAERSVAQLADVFGDAIRQMSVADARAIVAGPPDAATRYFERTAGGALRQKMLPIVQAATASAGATQSYKKVSKQLGPWLQAAGSTPPDLDDYVTDQALDALFAKIADEEADIRRHPAARGSALLQQVFGSR
jgi:hypothetical protein